MHRRLQRIESALQAEIITNDNDQEIKPSMLYTLQLLNNYYLNSSDLIEKIKELLKNKELFERKDFHEILISGTAKEPELLQAIGSEPIALMLFCALENDGLGKTGFQEEGYNLNINYDLSLAGKVKGKILYFFKKN